MESLPLHTNFYLELEQITKPKFKKLLLFDVSHVTVKNSYQSFEKNAMKKFIIALVYTIKFTFFLIFSKKQKQFFIKKRQ